MERPLRGYGANMSEACDLKPCRDAAVTEVRLVVEDADTTVRACERHAQWLRAYSSEDEQVRVVGTPDVEVEHVPATATHLRAACQQSRKDRS